MKKYCYSLIILLAILATGCQEESATPFDHPFLAQQDNPDTVKWYYLDNMMCRDSSPTGVGVRIGDRKKWVIYINGGGACFNDMTCATNPSEFDEVDFYALQSSLGNSGIFNRNDSRNPIRDWSLVFIPYCTGDVHSGNNPSANVPGVVPRQQFVGWNNFKLTMDFIVPYLEENDVEEIFLFGLSAGGYGVYLNFLEIAKRFPNVKITVINDSGPLFNDPQAFSPCLQLGFKTLYNLPIPEDLFDCCGAPELGLANVYEYSSNRYPQHNFGFISSYEDATSRYFLSFGYNNCTGAPGNSIPANEFRAALVNLRESILEPKSTWSTYFINGNSHTMLADDDIFYERPVNGVYLYQFVDSLLTGHHAIHLSE